MPQEESITLRARIEQLEKDLGRANRELDRFRASGKRAVQSITGEAEAQGRAVVSVSQTSAQQQAAAIRSAERRLAGLRGQAARIAASRRQERDIVGGDSERSAKLARVHQAENEAQREATLDRIRAQAQTRIEALESAEERLARVRREEIQATRGNTAATLEVAALHATEDRIRKQHELNQAADKERTIRQDTLARLRADVQTPVQKLTTRRAVDLRNVAGDPAAIDEVTRAYDRLILAERKHAALRTADNLGRFGRAATFGVTIPILGAAAAALKFSEDYRKADIALGRMLGSADEAKRLLGDLERFAQGTPFEFRELVPQAQRLKALGFEAKAIIPIMQSVGEAVAGVGGNEQSFDRITLALGQMQSKGRVTAQEMNQLTEALVPGWEILAERIGVSIPEAMKLTEKGAISASVAVPAILQGMLQRFAGTMAQQNNTITGQFSNLKDRIGVVLRDTGRVLEPLAMSVLRFGLQGAAFVQNLVKRFEELPGPIRNTALALVGLAAVIGPLSLAAQGAFKALGLLFGLRAAGAFTGAVSMLRSLPVVLGHITGGAIGAAGAMTALEARMVLIGKVGLVGTLAAIGYKAGEVIGQITGLTDTIGRFLTKAQEMQRSRIEEVFGTGTLGKFAQFVANPLGISFRDPDAIEATIRAQEDLEHVANKTYESLKRQTGIDFKRGSLDLQSWVDAMQQTFEFVKAYKQLLGGGFSPPVDDTEANRMKEALERFGEDYREQLLTNSQLAIQSQRDRYGIEAQMAEDALDRLAAGELLGMREVEDARLAIRREANDRIAKLDKQAIEERFGFEVGKLRDDARKEKIPANLVDQSVKAKEDEKTALLEQVEIERIQNNRKLTDALERERIARDRAFAEESREMSFRNQEAIAAIELRGLEHRRDAEIDALDSIDQQTLSGKILVEQKRAEIEQEYLQKSLERQIEANEQREKIEAESFKLRFLAAGYDAKEIEHRLGLIHEAAEIERRGMAEDTSAAIASSAARAARAQAAAVRDHNRSIFDTFKRESEGVFDAMLQRSESVWSAIGNSLKNAVLTALKDAVTSRVAAMLTELTTGTKVTLQSENTGGFLGSLKAALGIGATPVFGDRRDKQQAVELKTKLDQPNHLGDVTLRGGSVPVYIENLPTAGQAGPSGGLAAALGIGGFAAGALLANLGREAPAPPGQVTTSIDFGEGMTPVGSRIFGGGVFGPDSVVGAPGGTGGFAGPINQAGVLGALRQQWGGIKDLLTKLGNLGRIDTGRAATGAAGSPLAARGIGGVTGGALLLGGGLLALSGLQRGGVSGLFQTAAGGALIGAKFGAFAGPLGTAVGAAIGGGIGAIAGLFRLFGKSAEEKIQEKVKKLYGISIPKSLAKDPLLGIIKQNFGGNIDMGIRSPQIRELIQLYAMSTGQNFAREDRARPLELGSTGGRLFALPGVENGQNVGTIRAVGGGSPAATARPQSSASPQPVIINSLQVNVADRGAANFLDGRIVQRADLVAKAQYTAGQRSVNRRETLIQQTTPGLVLG